MPVGDKAARKTAYFARVQALFDEYPQAFLVECDNVSAAHLSKVRKLLRQYNSVVLMGKNTLMRKALRDHLKVNDKLEPLLPLIKGNMGFILCKGHLKEVLEILTSETVAAPAKAGTIAPVGVTIPAGNTGLEPTQTSFLQALNIATKIAKGQIEILKDVELFAAGQKVGSSEAALLTKLNINPFKYGLVVNNVYDEGSIYPPEVLQLTDNDLVAKFMVGVTKLAAASLAIGYPSLAALPHVIINGYKRVAAISLATDYDIEQTKDLKALLSDPEALARAAAASAGAAAPAAGGDAPAAAAEESEESEEEMGDFSLFD